MTTNKWFDADRGFALANLAAMVVIGLSVFRVLPVRVALVDVAAGVVLLALAVSALALALRMAWATLAARIAGVLLLLAGLGAVSFLTLGMTFVQAVAGPGTSPAPEFFVLVLLLALPYTLVYPIALLLWLDTRRRTP